MQCSTALFRRRHLGYRIGLGCLLAGTILYITGFATSSWCVYTFKAGVPGNPAQDYIVRGRAGLWVSCYEDHVGESHCDSISKSFGWIVAVKGPQGAAIMILAVCLFYVIHVNFLTSKPSLFCFRLLEAATGLAGGLALSGAVIYVIKIEQGKNFINDQDDGLDFDYDFSWSFVLSLMGCALFFLSTALVAVFNRPLTPDSDKAFNNFNGLVMPTAGTSVSPAPGNMADNPEAMYTCLDPPSHYSSVTPQGVDQGQAAGPMVFDTPPDPAGTK